ncbi:glycosyltransferase [Phocaeicola barnesiae]|uniref:glycosyltransferase family 2 protein n=1 Tax=Phocaeicola barnesiae TaxID=376804 RepID=UPI0025A46BAF|nr:glycosyltransferase [Phocaeicola barnesiae]MDM8234659.1 glycosyltransferase [Phocaeicola barnesiae]
MKLSIIVPVYNVEKYIIKCISSLLMQDTNDYEIVIINDGTKDNSIRLIKENFSDSRIRIINQENQGLSGARNTGLKDAQGEYVWYFDSDDWMDKNSLLDIIKHLSETDILYFNSYYEERNESTNIVKLNNTTQKGRELSKNKFHHPAQFYIYRKNFLLENNFFFERGIYHEDTLFTPRILYLCNKITPYNKPVYHLLRREGSITQTVNPKRCYDLMFIIDKLNKFSNKTVSHEDRYSWGNCIADSINELMFLAIQCNKKVQKDVNNYLKENKSLNSYLKNSHKKNTRIMGKIISIFKLPIFRTYKVLHKIRY